jgi:hypothetical protein
MAKLDFPYAIKEIQGLTLSHYDPIIVALLVKYEEELNDLIREISLEMMSKKRKKQVLRQEKKKTKEQKSETGKVEVE